MKRTWQMKDVTNEEQDLVIRLLKNALTPEDIKYIRTNRFALRKLVNGKYKYVALSPGTLEDIQGLLSGDKLEDKGDYLEYLKAYIYSPAESIGLISRVRIEGSEVGEKTTKIIPYPEREVIETYSEEDSYDFPSPPRSVPVRRPVTSSSSSPVTPSVWVSPYNYYYYDGDTESEEREYSEDTEEDVDSPAPSPSPRRSPSPRPRPVRRIRPLMFPIVPGKPRK